MKQIIAAAITAVFMTSAPAFANHGHIIQVHHGADYVTFALYEDAINICGVNNIFNSVITGGSVNPACMAQLPWYGITVAGRTTIPQLATFIGQTNAIDLVFSEFRANWNLLNSDAIIEGYSTATTQYAELAGCGKSRDFGKTVMKRARNGNPGLIKSTGYEGAKGDESGWKHHRPTFSAAC